MSSNFKIKSDKTLAKLTLDQLQNELKAANDQKVVVHETLVAQPDNPELRDQFEDLDIYVATISDMLNRKESVKNESPEEPQTVNDGVYKPEKGLENYIHVELTRGSKFDPETGKPVGVTHKQCYTYKQFLQLKRNAKLLGYKYSVLYAPEDLKSKL
jgi:hypothetical protein